MSDLNASAPRIYLVRHGETEWTKTGRYTSITDLPLTPHGRTQVRTTASALVGSNKLIDPASVAQVYVSPRLRALETLGELFGYESAAAMTVAAKAAHAHPVDEAVTPAHVKGSLAKNGGLCRAEEGLPKESVRDSTMHRGGGHQELMLQWEKGGRIKIAEELREWTYGRYEGQVTREIRELRKAKGLDEQREWDIWRDGCEDGETPEEVAQRVDLLIKEIRSFQLPYMRGGAPVDAVLIAHGHILRVFAKRWLRYQMDFPLPMMLEPGAVGILSYNHHSPDEPSFLLGFGLPVVRG